MIETPGRTAAEAGKADPSDPLRGATGRDPAVSVEDGHGILAAPEARADRATEIVVLAAVDALPGEDGPARQVMVAAATTTVVPDGIAMLGTAGALVMTGALVASAVSAMTVAVGPVGAAPVWIVTFAMVAVAVTTVLVVVSGAPDG